MAWITPKFSIPEVNSAGKALVRSIDENYLNDNPNEYFQALEIINNFRASHAFPLNTFQINLRSTARKFDTEALVAQRIKRMASISQKLILQPRMKLSQMQDLGGCRAIVANISIVRLIAGYYRNVSSIKHIPASWDDYIEKPKASGYRGMHLVYRYFSDKSKKEYNGMKIELQIRSRYQHAWATAVETVGMFSGQALKSSLGSEEWKRFFSLMGSVIAQREGAPLVPGTPTARAELIGELGHLAQVLQVENRLTEFNQAVHAISNGNTNAFYYLLQLDPETGTLMVTGYGERDKEKASERYAEAEARAKTQPGMDAVLVSVGSVGALAKAYPNYFADTRVFLSLLKQSLSGKSRGIKFSDIKLDVKMGQQSFLFD